MSARELARCSGYQRRGSAPLAASPPRRSITVHLCIQSEWRSRAPSRGQAFHRLLPCGQSGSAACPRGQHLLDPTRTHFLDLTSFISQVSQFHPRAANEGRSRRNSRCTGASCGPPSSGHSFGNCPDHPLGLGESAHIGTALGSSSTAVP